MTPQEHAFLNSAFAAAREFGPFAEMVACEAALESRYGTSELAIKANNLFGMKAHRDMIYQRLTLPTKEFIGGKWIDTTADWVLYPSWDECFADRVATLKRLAPYYPHYAAALKAASPVTYVLEVSRTWSTDPKRAEKVLDIYDLVAGDWSAT